MLPSFISLSDNKAGIVMRGSRRRVLPNLYMNHGLRLLDQQHVTRGKAVPRQLLWNAAGPCRAKPCRLTLPREHFGSPPGHTLVYNQVA